MSDSRSCSLSFNLIGIWLGRIILVDIDRTDPAKHDYYHYKLMLDQDVASAVPSVNNRR